jgi:hypothetical protein
MEECTGSLLRSLFLKLSLSLLQPPFLSHSPNHFLTILLGRHLYLYRRVRHSIVVVKPMTMEKQGGVLLLSWSELQILWCGGVNGARRRRNVVVVGVLLQI